MEEYKNIWDRDLDERDVGHNDAQYPDFRNVDLHVIANNLKHSSVHISQGSYTIHYDLQRQS